jgi:hypothetical protein
MYLSYVLIGQAFERAAVDECGGGYVPRLRPIYA